MSGLKLLNVSHNEIVEIPKNTFPKLYELHTIDLSNNNLAHISNGVFQTLFSFRFLNLSSNNLKEINSTTFGTVPTLLEINFNNNKIEKIVRGAVTKLSSLRVLTMQNNELSQLFDIPISLNLLDVQDNKISRIQPKTWPIMNALIELNLSNNSLENNLSEESFINLRSLRYLNLNNNGISIVPRGSFSVLSTLQYIYLEVIIIIPKKVFCDKCENSSYSYSVPSTRSKIHEICIWFRSGE